MRRLSRILPASLFWRAVGANALLFIVAGLALALSPATKSDPITLNEAATLVAGIAVVLLINLALMRRLLSPLTKLANTMRRVDPLRPGQRIELAARDRELADLVASFNDMLDRLEHERRASAHRELQAQDAEQRRIAGELHDEIGQRLTVLLLMLAGAQAESDAETQRKLQEARDLAHEIHDDLRRVVSQLRPEALDQLGITQALTTLAEAIEARAGVQISRRLVDVRLDVPSVVSLVVYRVAQEALTNAVRHAPGSPVRLELDETSNGTLQLRVSDAGPGLPSGPADRNRGRGLRWMAERALLIGATLELASSSAGTTLTLTVPNGAAP
jgi:two-component system, NarL family, sensor histidine kinase UhpB